MSRARLMRAHILLLMGVMLLAFVSGQVRAQDDEAFRARLEVLGAQAMEGTRDLARSMLPTPTDLGPGWRYPWQLPSSVPSAVASEDDYWRIMFDGLGPSGIPEEDARKLVDLYTTSMVAEDLDERTVLLTILHLVQPMNMPPHEAMLHSFTNTARLAEEIQAARARGDDSGGGDDPTADTEPVFDIMNLPFQGMSDAQLKEATVREFTFLDRLTEMSYFKSNDWAAIPGASDDALHAKGVWIGIVTIRVMLVNEDRIGDIEDPDERSLATLQGELDSAHVEMKSLVWQERERELRETLEWARSANDAERIAELEEQIPRERTAVLGAKLELSFCDFGESCYVLRLLEMSPDNLGIQASTRSARLRNGRAVVHISLAGNFPELEMTRVMDHFLSEVDARTSLLSE